MFQDPRRTMMMTTGMEDGGGFGASASAFLQQVARQRVTTYDGKTWAYFDSGRRGNASSADALPPLVCLPGTSGTALGFHRQMQALAAKGYRVIAVRGTVVSPGALLLEAQGCQAIWSLMMGVARSSTPWCGRTRSGCRASTGSLTPSTSTRCVCNRDDRALYAHSHSSVIRRLGGVYRSISTASRSAPTWRRYAPSSWPGIPS
jgi:hypothetical protein